MGFLKFFRKKKYPPVQPNLIIETTNNESINPTLIAIEPELSENVPPPFQVNKEMEFLNHIDGRYSNGLTQYHKSQFKDYKAIIDKFYEKGYLDYSYKENLRVFKVNELKEMLRNHGLKVSGNKPDLINRVYENIPEECIKNNSDYKIIYTLSDLGKKVLSEYQDLKNKYNKNRDDIIFEEELKKDKPYKVMLLTFNDSNNTDEFKLLLKKAMLLGAFNGERYEATVERFMSYTDEKLDCPNLDKFLDKPDGSHAINIDDYKDKLLLYIQTKYNEANYLELKNRVLEWKDVGLKITPIPDSCCCSTCPTKTQTYAYNDIKNNKVPKFPHHYGCMCLVTIDF